MAAPIKYNDPYYDALDKKAEAKVGLPPGLLSAIRLHGERTNADRVSSAGAKSVYQIIPSTRDLVLKKYGVDAYLSPENAAHVSALVLKEGYDRNNGDPLEAAAEYFRGPDKSRHGPIARAYVARIAKALNPISDAQAGEFITQEQYAEYLARKEKTPIEQTEEPPVEDDNQGMITQEQYDEYLARKAQKEVDPEIDKLVQKVANAPNIAERAIDTVTGSLRETPETEALPSYYAMPEMKIWGGGMTAAGTMLSMDPNEDIKILQAKYPGITVREDEKGNKILTSPTDGKDYAIKPGLELGDVPGIAANMVGFKGAPIGSLFTGGAKEVAKKLAIEGVKQASVVGASEAGQAAAGGDFNTENLAIAAAAPAVLGAAAVPVKKLIGKTRNIIGNNATARSAGSAGATFSERAAAAGVPDDIQQMIADAERKGILNELAATRHIEAQSLPVPIHITEGQATGDIHKISKELNMRGSNPQAAQFLNDENTGLAENIDTIRALAAPDIYGVNYIDDAEEIIKAYKAKDEALNSVIREKYKLLEEANGGELPISASEFVSAASRELSKKMKGEYVPKSVVKTLVKLKKTGNMTFEQFENLRTNLAAEARKYEAGIKADGNKAYAVNIVRNALEQTPINPGAAANVKLLADAARSAAKSRFDLIRNDPAWQAAIYDKVAPDDFTRKFLIKGNRKNVQTLKENLSDNPIADQAISSAVIRALEGKAGIVDGQGNFRAASYNNLLSLIEPKLQDIVTPEIADYLLTLGKVAKYTTERPKGAYVNESNTFVGYLADKAGKATTHIPVIGPILDLGIEAKTRRAAEVATKKSLARGAGIFKE
jgi:hypothetical protein